ncbi:MAG: hypothetical protein J7619_23040 [Dyadobacter sp.]|uniref:hypothetical protein n=1 Tax=Dyadobacter sp. TaxID=1914288 RepID=UPI001B111F6D|nr:hypothetical protein [Dyadobacter sp.]MBO9615591.1 hypothetical protein [Dyadobacter sp.]
MNFEIISITTPWGKFNIGDNIRVYTIPRQPLAKPPFGGPTLDTPQSYTGKFLGIMAPNSKRKSGGLGFPALNSYILLERNQEIPVIKECGDINKLVGFTNIGAKQQEIPFPNIAQIRHE